MLRWAIVFLVISLIAGGLGLANISEFTRKIAFILFGLFFLGFLLLVLFAWLLVGLAGASLGTDVLFVASAALME